MLGDFAQRRLPTAFVQAGDAWLSNAMRTGAQQLGAQWLQLYLTAPVLRFAWAPGVTDHQWWFGILMPSCDNVGRYFPLLVAHPRAQAPSDRIALDHLEAWFDHLAQAATGTRGEAATIDAFERDLGQAPPWPSSGAPPTGAQRAILGGQRYAMGSRTTLHQWLHGLALDDLRQRLAGCSVWWRPGASAKESIGAIVNGLPDPATFAQMLAGG